MPTEILRSPKTPKCLILLVKIKLLQNRRRGKACCDLRSEENIRQHFRKDVGLWLPASLTEDPRKQDSRDRGVHGKEPDNLIDQAPFGNSR